MRPDTTAEPHVAPSAAAPRQADDAREVMIRVRNVGKMYRIYERPQDRLKQMLLWRFGKSYGREFWALRDISFDIHRGETVGIIGRNGSGKSTLLQIIAGTLAQTEGEVEVRGRVAALLELGSGFNPEFTGRENVFLNGAILGLSREEMESRFDEIAAFADIGPFIDQPVKVYSSGMVVRLAFAVQVVVPKDILIVDEALAVGDMFFQAKCMARMRRMLDDGVTVLFVSHDIGAIKSLCQRALFLNYGAMEDEGDVARVVDRYFAARVRGEQAVIDSELPTITDTAPIEHAAFTPSEDFLRRSAFERIQNGRARFANVQIINTHGRPIDVADYDQPITLRMAIEITDDINDDLTFGYHITDSNGINIIYTDSAIEQLQIERPRRGERYIIDSTFRASLRHGTYSVIAAISIPINLAQAQVDYCDYIPIAAQFTVSPRPGSIIYGLVRLDNQTQITRVGQP